MRYNIFSIDKSNWSGFRSDIKADVEVSISETSISLLFNISEPYIIAENIKINSDVYKDSAVEFFISFNDNFYYNFEFNCIGTVLAQYGKRREGRRYLSPEILLNIDTKSSLGNTPFGLKKEKAIQWSLSVILPFTVFAFDEIDYHSFGRARGNFYKCGDNLPLKHYLSIFPIKTEKPDFHCPEFFQNFNFIP